MHRITVSLPEGLASVLTHEAERTGMSVSEIVRRAVTVALGLERPRDLPFAAVGRSGRTDTARKAEEILEQEWGHARHR